MAPLIDVVFLLLTFFVFAMLLMVRAQVLDVTLPTLSAGAPAEDVESVTISLDDEGGTFVDGERVERDALIPAVRTRLERMPGAKIYLAADTGGSSGDLLAVIDLLSRNGFGNFQLFGLPSEGAAPGGSAGGSPSGG